MNKQNVIVVVIVGLILVVGGVLHVLNPTWSTPPPTRTPIPPTSTPEPEPSEYADYKRLLFLDETLEELAQRHLPESDGQFEAFYTAHQHTLNGETLQAIEVLQAFVARRDTEVRARLWAWKALRGFGVSPSVRAQEVQGLVLEMPFAGAVDTLAVYADGRVRYLDHLGGIFIWEQTGEDNPLAVLTEEVFVTVQPLTGQAAPIDAHLPENPQLVRVSLLTYNGIYVVETSSMRAFRSDDLLAPLFDTTTLLLDKIAEIDRRGSEA